ncbi:AAA family ATPase [Thermoleophilum album]|uniref:AAA domain-containing protein n=1 Tax=Thermoleophilum album TaxID=29539 RepID=A0A1H6FH62_THEAL|nr:AAA family ATPase [Thermoleophilum album]SEH10161.1 AAA domain-containing protein [Thermoleophilum album]
MNGSTLTSPPRRALAAYEHPGCRYSDDGRTLHTFCRVCGGPLDVRIVTDDPPQLEMSCPAGCPPEEITAAYARYLPDRHREATNGHGPARKGDGGENNRRVLLTPASAITPERTRWAWAGRVPLGAVTILAGRQGFGKSTLIAGLSADLSRGRLEGDLAGEPARVVLLSYENHPRSTIVPRLMAAGADLDRVLILEAEQDGRPDLVSVPGDLERIAEATNGHGARLLVIDPLVAALGGGIDAHRDQDVRRALAPLAQLAEQADLAVLATIHLRKGGAADALDRVSGSIAFTAAARSVLAFGRAPNDEDGPSRVLAHAKCNVGPLSPSLAYKVEGCEVRADGGEVIPTSRVVLVGECETSAAELLSAPTVEPRTEIEAAAEWLADELGDGEWHPTAEIRQAAKAADIAWRTVGRARERLDVETARFAPPGSSRAVGHWRLPAVPSAPGTAGVARQPNPHGKRDCGPSAGLSCQDAELARQGTAGHGRPCDDPEGCIVPTRPTAHGWLCERCDRWVPPAHGKARRRGGAA